MLQRHGGNWLPACAALGRGSKRPTSEVTFCKKTQQAELSCSRNPRAGSTARDVGRGALEGGKTRAGRLPLQRTCRGSLLCNWPLEAPKSLPFSPQYLRPLFWVHCGRMCGRTAVTLGADHIRRACAYCDNQGERKYPEWKNADKYSPSFNKSPQSNSPVLLSRQHFERDASSSERILVAMRWGLVPAWFKEADPSKMQYNTFNCRSDTMMEKFCYKGPFLKGKRCVVLADGYYEWRQHNGQKQPYFIYFAETKQEMFIKPDTEYEVEDSKGRKLLTMAGIFDRWEPQNGREALYSYSIITVNASESVRSIHHRMPAILDGNEAVRKWLDFAEVPTEEALQLIQSIENIAFHPVSTIVNNSRNNSPECILPIELDLKQNTKISASGTVMVNWLKNKGPKKDDKEEDSLPKWSSQFIQTPPSKKTSVDLMHQWLRKDGGPSAKQPKKQ